MLFNDMTKDAVMQSIVALEADGRPLDVQMMSEIKNLYNNNTKPVKNPNSSDRIYNSRLENFTPINYTSMLVDKIATVLYGRAISRLLGKGNEDLQKSLDVIYKRNKSAFLRISKVASLCGYGAIRLRRKWDGTIIFDTYGFSEVTPIMDSIDPYGSPKGLVFSVMVNNLPQWAANQVSKKKSVYNFTEIITRNIRDDQGNITDPGIYKAYVDDKEVKTPSKGINPLGDYLGAVYWRGLDHPFESWGKSDILPLYETLVAINELFTDGRELMTWGIHSPVIITNAEGQVQWNYSPRSILQVKGGVDSPVNVKRLESGTQSFSDFGDFINMLLAQFHQTSRVPSVAVGDLNGIGKASSGRAFEIAMIPLKELIDEKETVCIPQEHELMREILAKQAYYGDITGYMTMQNGYAIPDVEKINLISTDARIEFSPIAFPDVVTGETLSGQVASGIRSQENAIQTLHEEWNKQQVTDEVNQIASESTVETDALAENVIGNLKAKMDSA